MRYFEVTITAFKTVVINAENEQEAIALVREETGTPFNWEIDDISIASELDSIEDAEDFIAQGCEDFMDDEQ